MAIVKLKACDKSKDSRFVGSRLNLFATFCLSALLSGPVLSQDSEQRNTRFYKGVPDPLELANHLFPQEKPVSALGTTRSIVIKDDASSVVNTASMPILFYFGNTVITKESLPSLDSFGEMMQLERLGDKRVVIEGHTDSIGTVEFNQKLSERRARAIKRYLVSQFDIDPVRLITEGKGEMELADSARPKHRNNRRVEFIPH